MFEIVLGSHNAKKLTELRDLLAGSGIEVRSLAEIPEAIEVEETGTSFLENARLKATEQARHLGRWVLAEDSGLSVDALGGQPGVYSARYSGTNATDAANNRKLLEELQGVPVGERSAFYTCQLCLADHAGQVRLEVSGICRGRIAMAEAGTQGFGYDPLFLIPEYHRTFGELGPLAKKALSHRSRAMRLLVPQLQKLAAAMEP